MKNYRKMLITGLACGTILASMAGCAKKEEVVLPPTNEEGTADVNVENDLKKITSYDILNATGEKVVELYVYLNGSEDKGQNFAGEGIEPDASVLLDSNVSELFAPVSEDNADVLTLEFVTESGYTGKFETLYREMANIHLLSADAMTGATPILFYVGEETNGVVAETETEDVAEGEGIAAPVETETEEVKG